MGEFPESVWMNIDYEDGGLMEWSSRQRSSTASQYIRSDLVPQWQPIETAPKDGAQILVEVMSGYYQVVSFNDDKWRENTNSLALRKDFTHWMPIPKVPE